MNPHGSYTQAFGNPIAPSEVRFAFFKYRVCRFLFSRDDTPVEPGAVAAGEAYNDFGMLTIVDKNKTKGKVRDIRVSADLQNSAFVLQCMRRSAKADFPAGRL